MKVGDIVGISVFGLGSASSIEEGGGGDAVTTVAEMRQFSDCNTVWIQTVRLRHHQRQWRMLGFRDDGLYGKSTNILIRVLDHKQGLPRCGHQICLWVPSRREYTKTRRLACTSCPGNLRNGMVRTSAFNGVSLSSGSSHGGAVVFLLSISSQRGGHQLRKARLW